MAVFIVCAVCGSCRAPGPAQTQAGGTVRTGIVAAEGGRGGVRLVFVDEQGNRAADITEPLLASRTSFTVDTQPTWSPDLQWLVFVSTRNSEGQQTKLWMTRATVEAVPVPLTAGRGVERDPVWLPNGKEIVFASSRDDAGFDLYRAPVITSGEVPRLGPWRQVTGARTDEVSPSVSPDGTSIAYAVFDRERRASHIWTIGIDGVGATQVTAGPLDQAPAWSPKGGEIAYAAPAPGRVDLDLYTIGLDGSRPRLVVSEPLAHQTDPAWSPEGQLLFATSLLRSVDSGTPFFWSLTAVDMTARNQQRLHVLHDVVGVSRVSFAIGVANVDAVRRLPTYDRSTVLSALRDQCSARDGDQPVLCRHLLNAE